MKLTATLATIAAAAFSLYNATPAGADDTATLTHIAIQDSVDGTPVDWLEHVTDEQFRQ